MGWCLQPSAGPKRVARYSATPPQLLVLGSRTPLQRQSKRILDGKHRLGVYSSRQLKSAFRRTMRSSMIAQWQPSALTAVGPIDANHTRRDTIRPSMRSKLGSAIATLGESLLARQAREPENSEGCHRAARVDDAGSGQPGHRVVPWCRTKALVPRVHMQRRLSRCATTFRCQHPFERVACFRTTGTAVRAMS